MGRMRTFTVALCLQEDAASESIRLLTLPSQTLFLFLGGLPKLVGFGSIWHLKIGMTLLRDCRVADRHNTRACGPNL